MSVLYSFNKLCDSGRLKSEINASTITIALDNIKTSNSPAKTDVYFKIALSTAEQTTLNDIVTNHVATPLPDNEVKSVKLEEHKTTTGKMKVAVYEPEGQSSTIISINYADRCSWYMGAVQVVGGSLNTSDNTAYVDPNGKTHWIDLEHGRLYDEDNIMASSNNAYKVRVYIDGVEQTSGFTVDYELGKITFSSLVLGVVTASYWYADKSWFRLRPKSGKVLAIKGAEVQFAQGTTLNGPFVFCPWFVDHPTYGTMEITSQRIVYKNFKDFISACNLGQGLIPAIGDVSQAVHVFPFNYARPKPIKYSENIEIRVYCASHAPVGGIFATATFYVTIDNE